MKTKHLLWVILQELFFLVAWFVVPVVLFFAKKTKDTAYPDYDPNIKKYKLPSWGKWIGTPDDILLPAGLYEPTVVKIYNKLGWWLTSYYWLAFRNIGHGITWHVGKVIPKPVDEMSEEEQREYDVFEEEKIFLIFKIKYGYKSVKDYYGDKTGKPATNWKDVGYVAVPRFTIRLKWQD